MRAADILRLLFCFDGVSCERSSRFGRLLPRRASWCRFASLTGDVPSSGTDVTAPRSVAIIGGGLAGLSTAYHLLENSSGIDITVFDVAEVGCGGASAVAGGYVFTLVHWSACKRQGLYTICYSSLRFHLMTTFDSPRSLRRHSIRPSVHCRCRACDSLSPVDALRTSSQVTSSVITSWETCSLGIGGTERVQ